MKVLKHSFFNRDTRLVARELLGKLIVHQAPQGRMAARIVETEAYLGEGDPASHASRGMTPRSAIMFGPPGHAYVYFNYGVHWLLNFVTEKNGIPGAVLIRAVEPVEGVELMRCNRPINRPHELTNGPAKLTKALGIDGSFNGKDVTKGNFFVADDGFSEVFVVRQTCRIGISKGTEDQLRYYIEGNKFVSKK